MSEKSLNIALIGTRGVPANYGGFETFAEEVSKQWVAMGHNVTVYGRKPFFTKQKTPHEYLGIKTKEVSTIKQKYLETPLNALMAYIDALKCNYDVILVCNAANSPFAFLLKLQKAPLIINVDGIERNRTKWNALGRAWYRLGELSSKWFANKILSDANIIADYYRETYNTESTVIRYGAIVDKKQPAEILSKFKLSKDNYILYVSRLEPENNALGVITAYNKVDTNIPLVIVGDAPYAKEYIDSLKNEAQKNKNPDNIIFTGYQFGDAYKELRTNCKLYVQATEVGGTHPALVESIAYGNCVIANDVPEHREVLLEAGVYYQKNDFTDLTDKITKLLDSEDSISDYRNKAESLAISNYSWSSIAKQYLDLFYSQLECFYEKN